MRMVTGTAWSVEDAQAYILDRVHQVPWSGCWLWDRAVDRHGYGQSMRLFCDGVKRCVRMHRVAYEAFVAPIPRGGGYHGAVVMHTCDVRACCNPDHLSLGTQEENVADMIAKCRQASGEAQGRSKLTESQVREIRARYASGTVLQRELAAEFGVSRTHVSSIVRAVDWSYLK